MKTTIFLLISFFLIHSADCQTNQSGKVGVIVCLDDSLTHNYIGITIFQLILNDKYPFPDDLENHLKDTVFNYLNAAFPKHEFIEIERTYGKDYFRQKTRLTNKEFKEFRSNWYASLQEKYGISSLIFIQNSESFYDIIYNSTYPIRGYGLYNGTLTNANIAYILLESYFFQEPKPVILEGLTFFKKVKELPRVTKITDSLSTENIVKIGVELERLVDIQISEIFHTPEYNPLR
ncbi:MAG: hypothetical protein HOO86_14150 [Bacteroidales bacterium]|nr:hypothetical protein [Bacteroidales bacterium]